MECNIQMGSCTYIQLLFVATELAPWLQTVVLQAGDASKYLDEC